MSQGRSTDFRAPRSSAGINKRMVNLIPPGVYAGMTVAANGTIAPGVLLSADGVRIQESGSVIPKWGTSWASEGVPPGDATNPRWDLIVCEYLYETSIPAPTAIYKVIQGTAASSPALPNLPDSCILLARGYMPAGAIVYTVVEQAGPPETLINCARTSNHAYTILKGAQAAMRLRFDINAGTYDVYIQAGGALEDGATITWGDPAMSLSSDGILIEDDDLNSTNVGDALAEIAGALGNDHYLPVDNPSYAGMHKAVNWPLGSTPILLWATQTAGVGSVVQHLRGYYFPSEKEFRVTLNAKWDTTNSRWDADLSGTVGHTATMLALKTNAVEISYKSCVLESYWTTWDSVSQLGGSMTTSLSGPLRLGASGPTIVSGSTTPPTATAATGSVYFNTDNGQAYIYSDGWKMLARSENPLGNTLSLLHLLLHGASSSIEFYESGGPQIACGSIVPSSAMPNGSIIINRSSGEIYVYEDGWRRLVRSVDSSGANIAADFYSFNDDTFRIGSETHQDDLEVVPASLMVCDAGALKVWIDDDGTWYPLLRAANAGATMYTIPSIELGAASGPQIYSGTANPPTASKPDGSIYVNTSSGVVYVRSGGAWYAMARFSDSGATELQMSTARIGGTSGPTIKSHNGAPTGTPTSGSLYLQTDAATGHRGLWVYNEYDGWVELT